MARDPKYPGQSAVNPSYPSSVEFLYALGNEFQTIKLDLERIQTVLEALGNPHRQTPVIHVAGTNGKGSVCALIESALRASGQRTGLYTSPHLVEPTERIRIQGEPVDTSAFTRAFARVHGCAEDLQRDGRIDAHPTYFETITSMAHTVFASCGLDYVVLETGMGGRLDATNVVDPKLCVITPIDFDHEKFLGNTIPQIAAEKAGIIKAGRPVVFARQRPEALAVLERKAMELAAPVIHTASWRPERLEVSAYGSQFIATGPDRIPVQCPLPGAHQVENCLTAVAALHALGVPPEAIQRGIAAARWPGRLERVRQRPDWFLDGAHNPAGASALADYIREFHENRRIWMVFAAMRDKDLSVIAPLLFPLAQELIFTAPDNPRAFSPEELRTASGESRALLASSAAEAISWAEEAGPEDAVFVTGSLYLVGEARRLLVG